jgi:hypothetical protein
MLTASARDAERTRGSAYNQEYGPEDNSIGSAMAGMRRMVNAQTLSDVETKMVKRKSVRKGLLVRSARCPSD